MSYTFRRKFDQLRINFDSLIGPAPPLNLEIYAVFVWGESDVSTNYMSKFPDNAKITNKIKY